MQHPLRCATCNGRVDVLHRALPCDMHVASNMQRTITCNMQRGIQHATHNDMKHAAWHCTGDRSVASRDAQHAEQDCAEGKPARHAQRLLRVAGLRLRHTGTDLIFFFHFGLLDRPGGTGARALRRAARRQGAASKGGGGPPASDPPGAPAADRATDKRPGPGRAG